MIQDFAALPRFTAIGLDRFKASCPGPSHSRGDRTPSLSGSIRDGKLLLKCWAGCETGEILSAMGLTWQALFLDTGSIQRRPDPIAERRARVAEVLEAWRQNEIQRIAEELRSRDSFLRSIKDRLNSGALTEDAAWGYLAFAYDGYSLLEFKFDQLLHSENVFELWRESRTT